MVCYWRWLTLDAILNVIRMKRLQASSVRQKPRWPRRKAGTDAWASESTRGAVVYREDKVEKKE